MAPKPHKVRTRVTQSTFEDRDRAKMFIRAVRSRTGVRRVKFYYSSGLYHVHIEWEKFTRGEGPAICQRYARPCTN